MISTGILGGAAVAGCWAAVELPEADTNEATTTSAFFTSHLRSSLLLRFGRRFFLGHVSFGDDADVRHPRIARRMSAGPPVIAS
jgi:hypothetical protein